jgi:tRNA threonylcarbamoyladenosine biosynthesis protein TsaB
MLLLAIDTSGHNGSIALGQVTPGQSDVRVIEVMPLDGRAFSAQLVPQIGKLLQKHRRQKDDLDAFAVVSGPGSFTGIRVGLAAVKALAEALNKPITTISLLEAIARSSGIGGRVLAALDAGRSDVYVGDYEISSQTREIVRAHDEFLLSREEFLAEAQNANSGGKTAVTPDPALAGAFRSAGVKVELLKYPDSGVIAQFGWERLQRAQTVRAEELEANYLRHSTGAKMSAKPK